jgi:hypothetical protein
MGAMRPAFEGPRIPVGEPPLPPVKGLPADPKVPTRQGGILPMSDVVIEPLQPLLSRLAQLDRWVAEDVTAEPLQDIWLHA